MKELLRKMDEKRKRLSMLTKNELVNQLVLREVADEYTQKRKQKHTM